MANQEAAEAQHQAESSVESPSEQSAASRKKNKPGHDGGSQPPVGDVRSGGRAQDSTEAPAPTPSNG